MLVVDSVGSSLCEGLIARLEDTYRISVSKCVLYRNLNNERPRPKLDFAPQTEEWKQCTHDIIMRRVCATIVAAEKQYVLHIVSVCL